MDSVVILGANSLIGQHLVEALSQSDAKVINVWNMSEPFVNRIKDNNNADEPDINTFVGLTSLDDALQGCDMVFNLYEVQDFSLFPDKDWVHSQNVEFVEKLVGKCVANGIAMVIHLSSVFLQCSAYWPNVYSRECEDYSKFRSEVPFPIYCESKHMAEVILRSYSNKIQSISARVGPVYGEGDRCSLICDSILLSEKMSQLPRIGDQKGVLQFVYAGNVAYALLKCADKLREDELIRNEVVLIQDGTPIRNFYDLALKPLYDDCNRSVNCRSSASIRDGALSFYLFFPLYCLLCLIAWLLDKVLGITTRLSVLPSPYYLHLVLHHWTFYSDFKLRLFLDYSPRFDYETSLQRSLDYYLQLKPGDITSYSWLPQ